MQPLSTKTNVAIFVFVVVCDRNKHAIKEVEGKGRKQGKGRVTRMKRG